MHLSASEILKIGLGKTGYNDVFQGRVRDEKNEERFRSIFGSSQYVVAAIWKDLQTTEIPEAKVIGNGSNLHYFFMSLHFLKCYPTENVLSGTFQVCNRIVGDMAWVFVKKFKRPRQQR